MANAPTMSQFRAFREFLREACGLYFADEKYARVAKVIGHRMSERGIPDFASYERLLTASASRTDELKTLAALLTVGETHFFRNKGHWRAFEECVLPWIVQRNIATGQRDLRIWCAGCSTGEEPYTVAIALRRSLPTPSSWSIEIIGTDLNADAIAGAERALYTRHSFRGVTTEIKNKYFEPAGEGQLTPRSDIRKMVRFEEMNLLDDSATAQMRDVDVVFCRNVLIYFDPDGVSRVLAHFHRSLRSDGYLFLGHAESGHGHDSGFAAMSVCNTFIYRPVPAMTACEAPPDVVAKPPRRSTPAPSAPKTSKVPQPAVGKPQPARTKTRVPTEKPAVEPPSLSELHGRAVGQLVAEAHDDARQTFEEILRRDPEDIDGILGLALILAGAGSSDAALGQCTRALSINPLSANAHCVSALVHEGIGDYVLARRELEKAVYLDEGFAIAHFRLASIHDRQQRTEAAFLAYTNTLAALPNDDDGRVKLYSGGYDKEAVAQICRRRLDSRQPTSQAEGRS